MSRAPKENTPLRIFREATGHSQKTFGIRLETEFGLSPKTYKAYENWVRALPERIAYRLMIQYGVDPESILVKVGIPKDLAGHVYSRSSYKTWPGERIYDFEFLPQIIQRATDRLIRMLLAARRAGHFTLALQILDNSIWTMQQKLSLEEHYRAITNSKKAFEKWDPIRLYTAGAPVKVPERAEFALAEASLRYMQKVIAMRNVCTGRNSKEFFRKEDEFFSPKRRP